MGTHLTKKESIARLEEIIDEITPPSADYTVCICYPPGKVEIDSNKAWGYKKEISNILQGLAKLVGTLPSAPHQFETILDDKDRAIKLWAIGAFLGFWHDPVHDYSS